MLLQPWVIIILAGRQPANTGRAPPPSAYKLLLQQHVYSKNSAVKVKFMYDIKQKVSYMKNRESSGHVSLYSKEASTRKFRFSSGRIFIFRRGALC